MNQYFITFRSVTFAQRGERLLTDGGILCSLRRTPRWMEEQGCGYALRIHNGEIRQAAALLRESRIPMRKAYLQKQDGTTEEVKL